MKNTLKNLTGVLSSVLLLTGVLFTTGCGPAKVLDVVDINPNTTVWVVPLQGDNSDTQVKFNSIEFLDSKKVAAKRIMVDKVQRSIGRMPWDYEWIPSVRVIKVDRGLITREWSDTENRGTSTANEGIPVNTKDNISLTIGLTLTVSIDELDASTYLYFFGERPLSDVADQNIRSYAVAELNRQVSSMNLIDFQQNQSQIYTQLFNDAKTTFKSKGITVQYLGNSEGWKFRDSSIQESINKSFIAQQDNKTAEMEKAAQIVRNSTLVLNAEAQKDAAQKLFEASQAAQFQNELQIKMKVADAQLNMSTRWDGKLPNNILPSNSSLLMSLGEAK